MVKYDSLEIYGQNRILINCSKQKKGNRERETMQQLYITSKLTLVCDKHKLLQISLTLHSIGLVHVVYEQLLFFALTKAFPIEINSKGTE